ncbi:probable fructokinase-7 [Durio zibethinus]|uniref:Probable fructokinase-7 n=1 Tax=Durio zibethinus TaxID=66656 RepID=A0A6P6A8V7_DURZI|nr:probable fructokinase-7 [Durio zibethinus]
MSIWDQADLIKVNEDEITFLIVDDHPYDDNVVIEKLFYPNLKLLVVVDGSICCRYYTKVSLSVESINSYIAWDFSLVQGKMNMDIGFSVEYINTGGEKTVSRRNIVPLLLDVLIYFLELQSLVLVSPQSILALPPFFVFFPSSSSALP